MTELADAAARRLIREQLDRSLLVEAGAGSGKTSSLVERMAALVMEGKCRVETMAAVTFTRKAAAELKGRFQLELERKRTETAGPQERRRLEQALSEIDRSFIGTVHSFCAGILRERPVEAGLDPDFKELDDWEDGLLIEEGWREYLLRVKKEEPELLQSLLEIGLEPNDLFDYYRSLTAYPEVAVAAGAGPRPDPSPVRQALNRLLGEAGRYLPERLPPGGWDQLQDLLRMALNWKRHFGMDDDLQLLKLLVKMDKGTKVVQKRWSSRETAKFMQERFDLFRSDFLSPFLTRWNEYRHRRATDFVRPALEYYDRLREEKSSLNYQDLLWKTATLLRDYPEVRRYFQQRYTHLLVDEFQDTDPLQAEILFYLTGSDCAERDWRRLRPRPGSLFVVGDPKQSIYRFRRADIDSYQQVKELITAAGGLVVGLTTNFRSLDSVGRWINLAFTKILPSQATPYQTAFAKLDTVRRASPGKVSGVRALRLPPVPRHRQELINAADAERVADWIGWALAGGLSIDRSDEEQKRGLDERPRPSDFMILMYKKAPIPIYARALERRGIPARIAGGGSLSASGEVTELLLLCRFLCHPENEVLLVAVLRGIFFGVSDQTLWEFHCRGGRFQLDAPLPEDLAAEHRRPLALAWKQLKRYLILKRKFPASLLIGKIAEESGLLPSALAGELGESRAARLKQCLLLLGEAERGGITSFSGLVTYLEQFSSYELENEIELYPGREEGVAIMNLHKAKGLEAPVVFLASPEKRHDYPPTCHVERCGETPTGYFLVERRRKFDSQVIGQPVDWERMAAEETKYLLGERERLLYVAATRARNLLVVSCYPRQPEGRYWEGLYPYLQGVPDLETPSLCPAADEPDRTGAETAAAASAPVNGIFNRCRRQPRPESAGQTGGEEIRELRRKIASRMGRLRQPSYRLAAVTSLVRELAGEPERSEGGRGLSWGRAVHRLLELTFRLGRIPGPASIRRVLQEEQRDPAEKEQVEKLLRQVTASAIWQEMLASKHKLAEVPFTLAVPGGKTMEDAGETSSMKGQGDLLPGGEEGVPHLFAQGDRPEELVITGTIDLIFRREDGWVIVDYKTDAVEREEQLSDLIRYYGRQLRFYRESWSMATGEPVAETGLYFTAVDRWVVVS